METIGKFYGAKCNYKTGKTLICFEVESEVGLDELRQDELIDIKASKHSHKRSLTANAFMWQLISKIAQAIGGTTTEVYRQCLREVGVTNRFAVRKEAVADAVRLLTDIKPSGTGDFAEIQMGGEAPDGYTTVVQYVGSSKYTAKEMSSLIDYVVDMAKMLGIETLTPAELQQLKENGYA